MEKHMKTRAKKIIGWSVVALVIIALIVGIVLTDGLYQSEEDISDVMQDGVLHEENKVDLFGLEVNPGLISAFIVTLDSSGICRRLVRQARQDQFSSPQLFFGRIYLCRRLLYLRRNAL